MSFNAAAAVHAKLIAMEWPSSSMERIKKANDTRTYPATACCKHFIWSLAIWSLRVKHPALPYALVLHEPRHEHARHMRM